jgi:signal recognition particle subunit SRP54
MFGTISEKFFSIFSKLGSQKTITAENIHDAVNEVRLALLEADVQYSIAKNFIKRVKEKAEGVELIKTISPGQQFAKIVHDELVALMGNEEKGVEFKKKPALCMMAGLQGSGKTTSCVKLANYLKKKGSYIRPCVVACDLLRPAAIHQLQTLALSSDVACFSIDTLASPLEVAKKALKEATSAQWDILIFDTAGRLHVDDLLMEELHELQRVIEPEEILFCANAALGQDAVHSAEAFSQRIDITGTILTMLDGTARAGAALTISEITKKPLKFEGIGERVEDFQPFNPISMADRILGMGDTINLVRRVEEHVKKEDAVKLEEKLRKASFTFNDYLIQTKTMKKMGSMKSLFSMLPGFQQLKDFDFDDNELFRLEAIVLSMTEKEREEACELTMSRRKRIAKGSGTSLDDVNKMVKSFKQTKEFFKNMPNKKMLGKLLGGNIWR